MRPPANERWIAAASALARALGAAGAPAGDAARDLGLLVFYRVAMLAWARPDGRAALAAARDAGDPWRALHAAFDAARLGGGVFAPDVLGTPLERLEPPRAELRAALALGLDGPLPAPAQLGGLHEVCLARGLADARAERDAVSLARKRQGAYFTPPACVDHLLDRALEPALAEHVARLATLTDADAERALLDLRVVDIAMGAGDFLVPAARRIERALARFVAARPGLAARSATDPVPLRRRVAERCLAGVDVDPLAVALARTALAADAWPDASSDARPDARPKAWSDARPDARPEAWSDARPDAWSEGRDFAGLEARLVRGDALLDRATLAVAGVAPDGLAPLDLERAFPDELGPPAAGRRGFDVVLGNPPWDKVRFETDAFFCRHRPGLGALPAAARKRTIAALLAERPELAEAAERERGRAARLQACFRRAAGAYAHQGRGHIDTAKLFTERILALVAPRGRVGVVLPRQALVLAGWSELRTLLFERARTHVAVAHNRGGWLFPDAHASYAVALVASERGVAPEHARLELAPGADSERALRVARAAAPAVSSPDAWRARVSSELALPSFSRRGARGGGEALFARLLEGPRLGEPAAGALRATPWAALDVAKHLAKLPAPAPGEPGVVVARSRDVRPFAFRADAWSSGARRVARAPLERALAERLVPRLGPSARSAPLAAVALAYRYPARADDTRTLIATRLPDGVAPATGYVHSLLVPAASEEQRLYLLGLANSLVWNWFARRLVDRHVTASVVRALPLPARAPDGADGACGRIAAIADGLSSAQGDDAALCVRLDVEVARAFELTWPEARVVLADFSPRAHPASDELARALEHALAPVT